MPFFYVWQKCRTKMLRGVLNELRSGDFESFFVLMRQIATQSAQKKAEITP